MTDNYIGLEIFEEIEELDNDSPLVADFLEVLGNIDQEHDYFNLEEYEQYDGDYTQYLNDNRLNVFRYRENSPLDGYLKSWYEYKELANKGIYPASVISDNYKYFMTGTNSDIIDLDLLAGIGDGKAKNEFIDFINEEIAIPNNLLGHPDFNFKANNDNGYIRQNDIIFCSTITNLESLDPKDKVVLSINNQIKVVEAGDVEDPLAVLGKLTGIYKPANNL